MDRSIARYTGLCTALIATQRRRVRRIVVDARSIQVATDLTSVARGIETPSPSRRGLGFGSLLHGLRTAVIGFGAVESHVLPAHAFLAFGTSHAHEAGNVELEGDPSPCAGSAGVDLVLALRTACVLGKRGHRPLDKACRTHALDRLFDGKA